MSSSTDQDAGQYHIVIKRIEARRHNLLRYKIIVYWDKSSDRGDIGWSYSRRGAHKVAINLIKKHEMPAPKDVIVEEYEL